MRIGTTPSRVALRKLLFALAVSSGAFAASAAAALPGAPMMLEPALTEPARMVCQLNRCWWQPDYYKYGADYYLNNNNYYAPRCNYRVCFRPRRW